IETTQLSGYEDAGLFNIFDAGSIPYVDVPYGYNNQEIAQQWGLYAQTRLSITDPLTVILGGRESWYEAKNRSILPTDGEWSEDPAVHGKFTPYVGVVYDLTKQYSVYASYADIFTPQTNLTASGGGVAPRVGNQYEVGVKGDFFDGALSATLAAFDIHDKNRAITDPDNPLFYIAAGSARSRGIEFTLSGEITSNWNVMAGYTYLETKYLDDPDNAGDVLDPEEPRHSFKLWNKYTFDTGALRNVSLGAGARIISSTQRGVISQGGHAVFDAQIGYKINDHAQVTITANNLFDRVYFDRIPTQYFGLYGEPRSIMADLKVKW
ncbi:MAG: TonB-dependent receptor, partial [Rhizobiaceae bacterium]|nr:TonB-dependent receptor [Rhizobiaceae bacterium]